jgi:hypothetical protein
MSRTYDDPWRQYRYDRNQADEALAEATRLMVTAQESLERAIATERYTYRASGLPHDLRKSLRQTWAKLYMATNETAPGLRRDLEALDGEVPS